MKKCRLSHLTFARDDQAAWGQFGRIACFACTLVLSYFLAIARCQAQQDGTIQLPIAVVVVETDGASIRAGADPNSAPLANIPKNSVLWVLDVKNDFYSITVRGLDTTGWISVGDLQKNVVLPYAEEKQAAQQLLHEANALAKQADLAGAGELLQRAAQSLPNTNLFSVDRFNILNGLFSVQLRNGSLNAAERTGQERVELAEKFAGLNHKITSNCLSDVAHCQISNGQFKASKETYRDALARVERRYGEDSLLAAGTLSGLAHVHKLEFQYAEATKLLQRALRIREAKLGAGGDETLFTQNLLADLELRRGRFEACAERLQGCLKLSKLDNVQHRGSIYGMLGECYRQLGEIKMSEKYSRLSYELTLKRLGPEDHATVTALQNFGVFCFETEQYLKAEEITSQVLEVRLRTLGEEASSTIGTMFQLGQIHSKLNKFEQAEEAFRRCLNLAKKTNNRMFDTPSHLGKLYFQMGRLEEAERLMKTALAIEAKRRKTTRAPKLASVVHATLSDLYVAQDRFPEAVSAQESARRLVTRHVAINLPGTPDKRRNDFLAKEFAPDLNSALSLGLLQRLDPRCASLSAGWLLNGKSLGQEISAEATLMGSPQVEPFVAEIKQVRDLLSQISLSGENTPAARKEAAALEAREQSLALKISEFSTGRFDADSWVPIGNLMSKIPFDSRLVSIAKMHVRDFSMPSESDRSSGEHYVAWVVPPIGVGTVQVIDLGPAKTIDGLVAALREQLSPRVLPRLTAGEPAMERDYKKAAGALSRHILAPLEDSLSGAKEIIVSPDSVLWTVPWETLITNDEQYLVEAYRVRYVTTGRDLVRKSAKRVLISEPVVFADPDYDLRPSRLAKHGIDNQYRLRSRVKKNFPKLPKTATEAANIKPSLEAYSGENIRVLLSGDAKEDAFKELQRPSVLVMSTHGYFESEATVSEERTLTNPLLRCGLALAGANQPTAEGGEDGILTGIEIIGTDLRGTELVVLSACESGLGEIQSGEGVAGLRQAFQLAGAKSVISSLWQVEDGETAKLMSLFFKHLASGMNKSESLRAAQLSRIESRRRRNGAAHPFFWAAFTLTGQE